MARLGWLATGRRQVFLLGGVLFAASPIAFTILYWASGIQELLAAVLVLAATERWWSRCRGHLWWTVICGTASIFAKESGFGLPLLLAMHLLWRGRVDCGSAWRVQWLAVALLALAVGFESALVMNSFATGPDDAYRLGGVLTVLGNVGIFGWWLGTPGPHFSSQMSWTPALVGWSLFGVWAAAGWWSWRQGRRLPLVAMSAALLSLGPSLVLIQQTHPYLAYVAAAGLCLAMADFWPRRWHEQSWLLGTVLLAAGVLGAWNMHTRLHSLDEDGLPSDPVVRAAAVARQSSREILAQLPPAGSDESARLILLQPPLRPDEWEQAERRGDRYVVPTFRHRALGGELGPRLIAGAEHEVLWANGLLRAPPEARVLCETGQGFQAWEGTWSALLYGALLDVMRGNFQRAGQELARALALNESLELFIIDAQVLKLSRARIRQQGQAYQAWMAGREEGGEKAARQMSFLLELAWRAHR